MQAYLFIAIFFSFLSAIYISKNSQSLSSLLQLYKKNETQNKIINRTPLTGGIVIFISFVISIFFLAISEIDYFFNSAYWIGAISLIFFIGILDDRFSIKHILRLFIIFLILMLMFAADNIWVLKNLYFNTYNTTFIIEKYPTILTSFFILLLLNSLNMADGINGNSGIIFLIYFFLLFNKANELNFFLYFFIPSMLVFLYYNFKNKIYLGDSGVYFLSTFVALYALSSYQIDNSQLPCEKIFLIFMIPGLDMFRLFLVRIVNKKNPFTGDLNHLHHLLINRFLLKKTLFIYAFLISWPHLFTEIINLNILIPINTILYLLLILYLKKLQKFF